jgi:glycosyltransferase involved in cell wall biosynthesis
VREPFFPGTEVEGIPQQRKISLKILKMCTSRSWGGMELNMVLTCEKLRERGHQVFPVCYPASAIHQRLVQAGFEPQTCVARSYLHPLIIRDLMRAISRNEIDIIQADYSRDLWTLVPANRLSKNVPLVLIKHIGTMRPKTDRVHRWIYRHVDYIIAISEVIRKNIIETHPVNADKVGIIHHGVDFGRFKFSPSLRERSRKQLGIRPNELLIGIIGRLQVAKGYLEFLEMARQIAPKFKNVKFLLIGEASRGEAAQANLILARVAALQLGERLLHPGYRDDIPELLAAMDLFVFPSYAEAFGLVLIEAMSLKLPVISSDCDGVLDIVLPGETGILIPPKDISQLVQAVEWLITDREKRIALGEAGFQRARSHFSETRMFDQIEALYQNLLASKKKA